MLRNNILFEIPIKCTGDHNIDIQVCVIKQKSNDYETASHYKHARWIFELDLLVR